MGDEVAASLKKTLTIQPGVTSLPISMTYNFVTEEYPEFVGSIYDDSLEVTLIAPDGTKTTTQLESVNTSAFFPIGGIDFPGGDNTVGHTKWKSIGTTISITSGMGSYEIEISDAGDDIYDSAVLIDNFRLKK